MGLRLIRPAERKQFRNSQHEWRGRRECGKRRIPVSVNKSTPFTWALAMRPSSSNCNPAPDLALSKPFSNLSPYPEECFFHRRRYEMTSPMRVVTYGLGVAKHIPPTEHMAHFQLGSFLIGLVSTWAQFCLYSILMTGRITNDRWWTTSGWPRWRRIRSEPCVQFHKLWFHKHT